MQVNALELTSQTIGYQNTLKGKEIIRNSAVHIY